MKTRRSLVVGLAFLTLALVASVAPAQTPGQPTALAKAGKALERAAQARAARKVSEKYDPTFKKYSKRYFGPGFDWRYFKAQGFAESGLNPNATSWVGAKGVMQLMPSTYQAIASHRPEFGAIDQPEWNIAAGIMHDRYLWKLWEKDIPTDDERFRFMFASYNAGEGTINRALGVARQKIGSPEWKAVEQIAPTVQRWRYTETLGYVRRIDSTYTSFGVIR
jgi:membrane-bound lytic murein transglycosylase F